MKKLYCYLLSTLFCLLSLAAPSFLLAEDGELPPVSKCWPVSIQISMNGMRDAWYQRRREHDKKVDNFNSRCAREFKAGEEAALSKCQAESANLDIEEADIEKAKESYLQLFNGYEKQYHNSNPNIVDGCNVPSGLPKGIDSAITVAYGNAPEGVSDRVRKGFQAIQAHDWPVAKAWFQDALLRDKDNRGLKSLIDLSEYTISLKQSASSQTIKNIAYNNLTSLEKNTLNMWIYRVRDAAKNDVYVDATAGLPVSALDKVRKYVYGLSEAERDKLFFPDDFKTELILYDMTK